MKLQLSKKQKAAVASYSRSLLAAVLGAVATVMAVKNYGTPFDLTGEDWKAVSNSLWAAFLPVLTRWANKNDAAFGRGAE